MRSQSLPIEIGRRSMRAIREIDNLFILKKRGLLPNVGNTYGGRQIRVV
jgi:hypothetical protein